MGLVAVVREHACPHCGRGAFTVKDNSDAPIPIRVPHTVHDDEGRSVHECPHCDEPLHQLIAYDVVLDALLRSEVPLRVADLADLDAFRGYVLPEAAVESALGQLRRDGLADHDGGSWAPLC